MGKTSIEWCDRSVNPIRLGRGHFCQKISPGCANCYASKYQPRVGNHEFGGVGGKVPLVLTELNPSLSLIGLKDMIWFDESKLQEVLRRQKPTRWFWCDMTDLFGSWVPDEWIDKCVATMALTNRHTHQVLTKRPDRMLDYFRTVQDDDKDLERFASFACDLTQNPCAAGIIDESNWPFRNLWLGVSVEDQQRADERIPLLIQTPAAVRFLSCEPLLGPLDLRAWLGISQYDEGAPWARDTGADLDWVIVGGESGSKARPCDVAWIRSIVQQCKAAGIACFVKQLGSEPGWCSDGGRVPGSFHHFDQKSGLHIKRLNDRKGGDPAEWPEDLRVREFPQTEPAKCLTSSTE